MPQWTVNGPERITFDEPVDVLRVRTVSGAVHVVAGDGPARLEVSELDGPPLVVTHEGGTLTVAYEELTRWEFSSQHFSLKGIASLVDSWRRRRHAVVSLAVPAAARVELVSVGADVVVSGIAGPVAVRGAGGDTTLVRVSGPVEAQSVSGSVEAQAVSGDLKVQTVSGELTVVEASGPRLHAHSVSGSMTVDLDGRGPADVRLNTVSGEVAVRMPHPADTRVDAGSTSGEMSSAFDELRMGGTWGARRLSGRLGAGTGRLQVTTVSGSVALLRRPPAPGPGEDGAPGPAGRPDLSKRLSDRDGGAA
ncbi:DUF4097 family beta strand repeat-containing protein [Streptacidiphilus sp. ASG 303]|uniref:DUF4097 family beta strand repeat-containing protein n=1 Tax=Streptacidiphilus sp. ASG 303 TaxID=2896847 RepID=UPI001E424D5D|nr:DUF4097 family beta strand repeat-containing protein [Streptacidiphilus sp. ASG 303]MCD0482900.1 DUF4097 family beta strand repeat-containing protein [Streptacidiphilus sp. ASG 303]